MKAFAGNRIDAAFLWSDLIVEIAAAGGDTLPCVTHTIKKRRKSAMCLWHKKESKTSKLPGVAGKTLIGSGYSAPYLVSLRDYLSAGGVDKPLWRVFKSFASVSSNDSAFMAVAMGDADFFWTGDDGDALLKALLPAAAGKLKHDFCTDRVYAREAIIFNEKTLAAEDLAILRDNMKKVLMNMKEYAKKRPELKAFKQYMKMMEMKIIPADEDEFKVEFALYDKAVKNGWYAEAEYIADTMRAAPPGKPVAIKPDGAACAKICAEAKDKKNLC